LNIKIPFKLHYNQTKFTNLGYEYYDKKQNSGLSQQLKN